jgi:hypothetical protein
MPKVVFILLEGDIPDTEINKPTTVTIETRTYKGTVIAIVSHIDTTATSVTLEGAGLKVKTV